MNYRFHAVDLNGNRKYLLVTDTGGIILTNPSGMSFALSNVFKDTFRFEFEIEKTLEIADHCTRVKAILKTLNDSGHLNWEEMK
jgi:hypothetical protein